MRTKLLILLALPIALMVGSAQAQVVIYDNFSPAGGNVFFNGGPGNPQSRNLLGDDIDVLAPTNTGDTYLVDNVDFALLAFGTDGNASTTYNDVEVNVSFISGVATEATGAGTAANFATGTVLGSTTFALGDITSAASDADTASVFAINVDFSGIGGINIGDGQDIGVTFEFADSTQGSETGRFGISYRNDSVATNAPVVGSTSDVNFRDENGNGVIDNMDNFSFGSDARLRFAIEATVVAVPEPTSIAVLGFFGLGLIARRRR